MKQTMTFAIMAIAAIILASSFNLHMGEIRAVPVPESMAANVLYVCQVTGKSMWQSIATGMHQFRLPILIMFFFAAMIVLATWGWALYQNLLNDKFDRKSFSGPWSYTKTLFWAGVIVLLLMMTPNHYRRVTVVGDNRQWVLCENTTPDAKPVRASAVHAQ